MPRRLQPCGTRAAYYRHLHHGETPCAECSAANIAYQERWRRKMGMRPNTEANPRPPCGTAGGYDAHRYRGEEACVECKAAHAEDHAAYMHRTGRYKTRRQKCQRSS